MVNYCSPETVYNKIGVTSTEITSSQMDTILDSADAEVERIIKTTCKPKTIIELHNGDNKNYLFTKKYPILSLLAVKVDDTDVNVSKCVLEETGRLILDLTAEKQYFNSSTEQRNVKIKYSYGWLEEPQDQIESYLTSDVSAGDNVTVSVTATEGFNFPAGEYVKITGFDGNEEVTKIKSRSDDDLVMDLKLDHETGSQIKIMEVPAIVKQLAAVIAAIMGATKMMGQTYTFATGYTMPDYSVQKGVPYPHFNRNMEVWVKERDFIISQLPAWPVFA